MSPYADLYPSVPPASSARPGQWLLAVTATGLVGCAALSVKPPALRIEPVMDIQHAVSQVQAYYLMGRQYDGRHDNDRAIAAYRQALEIDPGDAESWNALGVALARRGDLPAAIESLEHAVAADGSRSHLLSNLGYALLLDHRPAEAVARLEAALALDPGNEKAREHLQRARASSAMPPTERMAGDRVTDTGARVPTTPDPHVGRELRDACTTRQGTTRLRVATGLLGSSIDLIVETASPTTTPAAPTSWPPACAEPAPVPAAQAASGGPVGPLRVIDRPTLSAWSAGAAPEPTASTTPPGRSPAASPRRSEGRVTVESVAFRVADADDAAVVSAPARAARLARLEIRNGHGVAGAARRWGAWLSQFGARIVNLGNDRPYVRERSVIRYRSGYEADAQDIGQRLGLDGASVGDTVPPGVDVQVLLGHDLATREPGLPR